jgi:para-aminobenzoate synthetase component 2
MFDILRVIDDSKKVLGICLGHQAIAAFYGAQLFRQAFVQHGQRKRILNICNNPKSALFNMPKEFEAGLYHSWAVDANTIGQTLSISCMSEDEIVMGVCHNDLRVEGVQFHPESFLTKSGPDLLNNWLVL